MGAFYDYKVMREIPFEASRALRAYHKAVVAAFDATLPLHRAVYEAREAESAAGWNYETSYKKKVKPHQERLEKTSARSSAKHERLWKAISPDEQAKYDQAVFDFHVRDDNVSAREEKVSPSGRYRLVVTTHPSGPGTWSYTRGKVYVGDNPTPVADVVRNYHDFWHTWVEGHPKGDFLLCGSDYQGQTVIALPGGERMDSLSKSAEEGFGFCWARAEPSPDSRSLAVYGCIWAGPYETRIFDFSDPLALPYAEVGPEDCGACRDFSRNPDGSCTFTTEVMVRKSDGKPERDLTREEVDALDKAESEGTPSDDLWEEREETVESWRPSA